MARALHTAAVVVGLCFALPGEAAPEDIARVVREGRGQLEDARVERRLLEESERTRTYDLRVVDDDGVEIAMYLREPKRPEGEVAAMLLLAGFETGRESLDLVEERDDVIVMSMDYPWGEDPPLEPTRLQRLRRTARRTVDASVLAVDYLAAQERVDEDRIVLVGVSFGALFATPVAAYDDRVDALVLIYGGGGLGGVVASNPPRGLGWVPPGVLRAGAQAFADDYDPLHHVEAVSPRPLLMANSTRDETFPPASAEALYQRAREPKELRWFDTGHGDLFHRRVVAGITAEVVDVLEEWGLVPGG